MKNYGQAFLDRLADSSDSFAVRFARVSTCLGLGISLPESDVMVLYRAAFYAAFCNVVFNDPRFKGNREESRRNLECCFMGARDELMACVGWQALPAAEKQSIHKIFLDVGVIEENLAR
jgi:hypothetical protein